MRILLQHVRTQLYFQRLGSWTSNPLEAFDFRHPQSAIDFARTHALPGVQLAIKVNGYDEEVISLPAHAEPLARRVRA